MLVPQNQAKDLNKYFFKVYRKMGNDSMKRCQSLERCRAKHKEYLLRGVQDGVECDKN
jgi:hypothetical protein